MPHKILQSFDLTNNAPAISCGLSFMAGDASETVCTSPLDGKELTRFKMASQKQAQMITDQAQDAFEKWKNVPAKTRAGLLHTIAEELTKSKDDLAELMTHEMGKPLWEAKAEVQNCIDTANYAATLWPNLGGSNYPSGRDNVELYDK